MEAKIGLELDEYSIETRELFGRRLTYKELAELPDGTLVILVELYPQEELEDFDDATVCVKREVTSGYVTLDDGTSLPYRVKENQMELPDTEYKDYRRIYLVKGQETKESEAHHMIQTELRTPPADVSLAVTEQYTVAYNLNVKIHTSMQAIQQNLYDMCSALKKMRDGKLYKELGYQNFEGYCENETPFSRRQAYKYITIMETLPSDFVNSSSQIGVQKMYLLTALTDDQREEITHNVDLESTTVRELKEQIAALQHQNSDSETARQDAEQRAQKWYDDVMAKDDEINSLTAQIHEQLDRITELENRPVEVAVPEPSHELQNMQDAMRRINLEHEQWSAKMQDDHIKHVQEINRQHRAETDAMRAEYEEKLAAAQASPAETPEPDSKEIFNAYLANAIDAAKRMTAFLAAHPNEACRKQAEKFFQTMIGEVST